METPLVSIICPVFNSSDWLSSCIESVLGQDYTHFELLLVDDGSTDSSPEICDGFAARDRRIRVFHQGNAGASSARNKGLEQMSGEWVCFLDSDDEWMEGGLRTLVSGVSDDIDLVMAGYETYDERGEVVYSVADRTTSLLTPESGLMQVFRPTHYRYFGNICSKLFRSSVIRNHRCRFAEDIRFCEDRLFTVQYICASMRPVRYFSAPVYKYRMHPGSAMDSLGKSFNPLFITDLDATIRIRETVHASFPEAADLCRAADKGVYASFRILADRIKAFRYPEVGLERRLRRKAMDSIGLPAFAALEAKRRIRVLWKNFSRSSFRSMK